MTWAQKQKGFTIVELLIVVVVIAILAAITIVAYNGITQRARNSVAQNALSDAAKKLALYSVENGDAFPPNLVTVGLSNANGVTYQYSFNNTTTPKGYCVTATISDIAYYLGSSFTYTGSSTGTINQVNPATGVCPGHSATGSAITNLSINPGVEVNANGYAGPNSSTVARTTTKAHQGAASLLVTMPLNGSGSIVGSSIVTDPDVTSIFEPNTVYTVSAWVWVPSSTVDILLSVQGTGRSAVTNQPERLTSVKNQWARISNTFTTSAAGNIAIYALNSSGTAAAGTQFYLDDVIIAKGSTAENYADGNTAGWIWNGVAGNSTSTGPAV